MGRDVLDVACSQHPAGVPRLLQVALRADDRRAIANNADEPERSAALEAELGDDVGAPRPRARRPARCWRTAEYLVVVARKAA